MLLLLLRRDPPTLKHGEQDNLWPSLQETAAQPSLKPPPNTLAFGDLRIDVFKTCNNSDFKAPFPGGAGWLQRRQGMRGRGGAARGGRQRPLHVPRMWCERGEGREGALMGSELVRPAPLRPAGNERLRSPNRNEDLAMTTASLVDIYTSAYNRVGE